MAERVAKTYSQALFEVGLENNNIYVLMEELKVIRDMFKEYPNFYEIMTSPKLNTEEKKKIVDEVLKDKATDEISNFMKILIDKKRVKEIFSIVEQFENLIYEHKGIVKATAVTTVLLGKDEKDSLIKKLESITGKKVELINEIDKSVLGGVLIKLGDQVIDGTLRGKLNNLQKSLKEIIV